MPIYLNKRIFKKGRGQRDLFSSLTGMTGRLDWKSRDVVIGGDDKLRWLIPDGPKLTINDDDKIETNSREEINVHNCYIAEVIEDEIPLELKSHVTLNPELKKFYTIEFVQEGKLKPIKFGDFEKENIEWLRQEIKEAMRHAQFVHKMYERAIR